MGKVTAWSYTRWALYETCPRKFKFKVIDKLQEETSWAAERGNVLHAKAEQMVRGKLKGIPKELKVFGHELKELRKAKALTEVDLSVTRDWSPTTYDDWNNVWCRGNADAIVNLGEELVIIDYKTGKIYDSHKDQAHLYATQCMSHFPQCKTVLVEFWYFDQDGHVEPYKFRRAEQKQMQKYWEKAVKPMMSDVEFIPRPGNHCRWCQFADQCPAGDQ